MARDPRRVRTLPGVTFAKFLGTGKGVTFGPGDADLTRFAAVIVSAAPVALPEWDHLSSTSAVVSLTPLHSVGTWSGRAPFTPNADKSDGMVLALTRARLHPLRALTFYNAVPPVVAELDRAPGLLARFGIGEAPIGWQGTVSVWRGAADLRDFAYRQPEHRAVIDRTPTDKWYAEDLFARFAVRDVTGDRAVLGWITEQKGRERR
ncbi:monooxygenase [Actinoplanes sp. NPDC049265]|uniref:monooxygenase n=1 Tax=Actinoplanes sp. NPDC049265 TaxID=3363902 RepID=UPI003718D0EB